jgi:5-methylcytosine-specific restriction endonuclease McrA
MNTCEKCNLPCAPRKDRPGKFWLRCIDHQREFETQRHQRWRKENYEEYVASYQTRNADPQVAKRRNALIRVSNPIWRANNPDKARAKDRRAWNRRRAATGTYTEEQWLARLAFWGWRCYLCNGDWFNLPERDRTIDHVIPVSKGGTNWPANLRPACRSCNSKKNAGLLFDLVLANNG